MNRRMIGIFLVILFVGGFAAVSHGQEEQNAVPASRIINAEVYDSKEELIGEVDDIIIRRSGTVKKLTVEFGGFMDIGDKLVSLRFNNFSMEKERIVLDITEQQLDKKEEFNYYRQGLRSDYYYRTRPYGRPYYYTPPPYYYGPDYSGPGRNNPPSTPYEWAYSPSRFLASTVMARRLMNESGKHLGIVADLVFDVKNRSIEKIVVASDDILGEDVRVALPYKPLGFTVYGLVYDIAPRKLKEMPRYSR